MKGFLEDMNRPALRIGPVKPDVLDELHAIITDLRQRLQVADELLEAAAAMMKSLQQAPKRSRHQDFDSLVLVAARTFGVTVADILSRSRVDPVLRARFSVYYVAHDALEMTLTNIGHPLERTHGAVQRGLRSFRGWMSTDDTLRLAVMQLNSKFTPKASPART